MNKLAFIVPHFGISGGIHIIFRHAEYLANNGFDVYFVAKQEPTEISWYPKLIGLVTFVTYKAIGAYSFDMVFASSWETVYKLPLVKSKHYVYLVQAPEVLFIPFENKLKRSLAEYTYISGIKVVTIATWLQQHLLDNYGVRAYLVKNGLLDLKHCTADNITKKSVRFLVEGSITDVRKMVPQTIKLLKSMGVKDIGLLTSSRIKRYPGVTKLYSLIPIDKVGEVYSRYDVLVKLSTVEGMFGPPLEMFKCGGTAITFDVPGHEEYMVHGVNSLIAPIYDFDKVREYVDMLIKDNALLNTLKVNAQQAANSWKTWNEASAEFMITVEKILATEYSNITLIKKRLLLFYNTCKLFNSANIILLQIYLYGVFRKLTGKIKLFIYNIF
ncbi:MAG: glycosyltransferase [Burkholderiales bacterium]|nr:glycosyltransferase [Burkholderiales bacterium]